VLGSSKKQERQLPFVQKQMRHAQLLDAWVGNVACKRFATGLACAGNKSLETAKRYPAQLLLRARAKGSHGP
jgi:hypothetical protein